MLNEPSASKWAVVGGNFSSGDITNDRAGNPRMRCVGGFRAGTMGNAFGRFWASSEKGLLPMYPIPVTYWNLTDGTTMYLLGFMKDVRGINIKNYEAGDEVTVGSDTWMVFPSVKKGATPSSSCSGYQGIAYKKVTT